MNGYVKCGLPTHNGILFKLTKKWNWDIHYKVDEPGKHFAKWNKPDTKGFIVWFHLHKVPRTLKFIEEW